MANHFDGPPALAGDAERQLEQMYRYLQTMSDQLNESMNGIAMESAAQGTQRILSTEGGSGKDDIASTRNALRSMIIKTAEIVRNEMEEISTELHERYTAISSQFGELDLQLTNQITANARGISQNYEYIENIRGATEELGQFYTRLGEYIFSGLIGYNQDTGLPIYGIAVGENITQYDADGNPYINENAKMATFTKERLSFWQGNTEMAYFSNKKLYITAAEVLQSLTMGRYVWKILADGSMALMVAQD